MAEWAEVDSARLRKMSAVAAKVLSGSRREVGGLLAARCLVRCTLYRYGKDVLRPNGVRVVGIEVLLLVERNRSKTVVRATADGDSGWAVINLEDGSCSKQLHTFLRVIVGFNRGEVRHCLVGFRQANAGE